MSLRLYIFISSLLSTFLVNTNVQSQSYDHRIINASIQEGLSSEYINSIYQGKDGFIWVSTKRGVDRYDGYKFTPIELPDSLSFGAAEHFMIDKSGRKYISTENEGIIVINNDLTSWKIYKTNAFGEKFYLPSIFEDSKNNIWILSYGQGLSHLDVESEQLTSYVHSDTTSNSIGDNQIYQMVEGPNGMLWLGTENGGLVRFNPETREFKNYQN
ncbi:MAG: two-component regulator propeller domain-containing protein, partial [Saprospiraceae bacterium]|nr:two-component regulator propeller domain-containing protein [Saprospiraceae bacterium]